MLYFIAAVAVLAVWGHVAGGVLVGRSMRERHALTDVAWDACSRRPHHYGYGTDSILAVDNCVLTELEPPDAP